jgi:acetyltransferase-like isoleucine patch superfamily enzyme
LNNELFEVEKISKHKLLDVYKLYTVGRGSWFDLFRFEMLTLIFGSLPGALGFLSRMFVYPSLFCSCGSKIVFGRNLSIYVPSNISLGSNVIIEDYVTLNAKTGKIDIRDGVFLSRNCYLNSFPDGLIKIGAGSGIGLNSSLHGGGGIIIGNNVMVAQQCVLLSQAHNYSDLRMPIKEQGIEKAKVTIEDDAWIGSGVKILPGVNIGKGAIVGAGSVVTKDLPAYSISYGIPAQVKRLRT